MCRTLQEVTGDEKINEKIVNAIPIDLELVEGLPIYCKMGVSGFRGPVKISINYVKIGHVTIYASLSNKTPS